MTWTGFGGFLREVFTYPLVAWLIRDRSVALGFLGTGIMLGGLQAVGVSVWKCPIREVTGWDCPGCGLTRGAAALGQGDLRSALDYHLLTPLFAAGALALFVGVILPRRWREKYAAVVERAERASGITATVLVAGVIYGLTRNVCSG